MVMVCKVLVGTKVWFEAVEARAAQFMRRKRQRASDVRTKGFIGHRAGLCSWEHSVRAQVGVDTYSVHSEMAELGPRLHLSLYLSPARQSTFAPILAQQSV